jgi:hypothetical protein
VLHAQPFLLHPQGLSVTLLSLQQQNEESAMAPPVWLSQLNPEHPHAVILPT